MRHPTGNRRARDDIRQQRHQQHECELMARVNIHLEDDVHTKAKVVAVLKGTTLNEYLAKAIAEALAKDKEVLNDMRKKLDKS